MELDHINISAPAALLKVTKDFYCEILQLNVGLRPNLSLPGYWLYSGDLALVHMFESDRHSVAEQLNCLDHVAFKMTNVDALIKRLQDHNVEYIEKRRETPKQTQIFFHDPAGIRLEAIFYGE
ncbi:VOC family protein [Echinimonas agarilytica]|uniref:VOC family protein n=1 Tax=Echinimonas agarilytica TaxID=1215918 RepID=A0AA41W6M1_9GAMM|nr:VOC family protein [Echinimonas agarilytica]MCM2680055.1 VOC family protein [Echinimonas agarilytica]